MLRLPVSRVRSAARLDVAFATLASGVLLLWLLLGAPTSALAQQGGKDLRLGVGAALDFAGGLEVDYGLGPDEGDKLRLTPGLRVHLDYDVHRYIHLGGLLRASFWRGDDIFKDRSLLMDFMFRLAGHYDFRDFRFYLALTVGPTLSVINDENAFGNNFDPTAGIAVGLTPGFEWWFSRRAALFVEMFGWNGHYFSHELGNTGAEVDFRINQVSWQLGVALGL